ncbi:hypothetical protein [Methylobacterium durans]|uniref:Uncharacterized protein n=1 Tax=Methylobacterium durans TaxID=2202825 RepID=A0A2U8W7U7_9HYPH|nr:hypothetical protein [Methylobacterium durans]AWN41570.1 hypothetical protein DK389_14955 [Methylobacterium durans]
MPITSGADDAPTYTFAVYNPPAPGLPWVCMCLHPDGRVIAATTFRTRREADAETERCASDMADFIEARKQKTVKSLH